MKQLILGIAGAVILSTSCVAERQVRFDKSISEAAAEIAATKLGELRGLIEAETPDLFVTKGGRYSSSEAEQSWRNEPGKNQQYSVPFQSKYRGDDTIDPTITSNLSASEFRKFDRFGKPMAHHQLIRHKVPAVVFNDLLQFMGLR